MRDGDDSNFLFRDLVDDAVRKPAKQITAPRAAEDPANRRVRKNQIRRPLNLSKKRKPEQGIRFRRIELRGLLNLGACERADNEIHRNAARI